MKIEAASAPLHRQDGTETLHLSDAGGLRQIGCYIQTLAPGAVSSERHWHEKEDEFLFVLEGTATVTDNHGPRDLGPGDAVCWPHAVPNAHHVTNRGAGPLRYLILGSRVQGDICHYPDSGRRLENSATDWQVVDAAGTVLRGGPLPDKLLNLLPLWGHPREAADPANLTAATRIWSAEADLAHPVLGAGCGDYSHAILGDAGGLTQFGVHLEELPPGSTSSFRHWHEAEDEMVLMLQGALVLTEDHETPLLPGDAACWPAGAPVGHRLQNRSDAPARYLVIGTRHHRDVIHYPDHDLITHKDGPARRYLRADGTPHPTGGKK